MGQAVSRIGIALRAKLQFLSQETHLNKDKGLRIRTALRLLKGGHREGDAIFVGHAALPETTKPFRPSSIRNALVKILFIKPV
jgi:hypothetical protein